MQIIAFLLFAATYLMMGGSERAMLANPLVPILAQAGAQAAGFGLKKLFGGDEPEPPDAPDLTDEVDAAFDRARSNAMTNLNERTDRARAGAAAQGLGASGQMALMNPVYQSNRSAIADLSAQEAQAIAEAENREQMMEYQTAQGEFQRDLAQQRSRDQAIGSLASGVGNYFSNRQLLGQLSELSQSNVQSVSPGQGALMDFITQANKQQAQQNMGDVMIDPVGMAAIPDAAFSQ